MKVAVILIVMAAGTMAAAAPDAPAGVAERVLRADENTDGRISFDELKAAAPGVSRGQFDRWDQDGDGMLTAADAVRAGRTGARNRVVATLRRADADHNRQVSYEELSAVAPGVTRARFDRWDRNGDGVLSRADRAEDSDGSRADARRKLVQQVRKADADGDGAVSFDELTAAKPGFPRAAFDRLDRNGDGVLSSADRRAGTRR